jgi:arylsulfatase A-like enzyme
MMKKRCVLIVCDSLRRDLLGKHTPHLNRLAEQACQFSQVEAVFPSTTRVSAACIATGKAPAEHGLLGNTMIVQTHTGLVVHSIGKPEFRQVLHYLTGEYLKKPTLAQQLMPVGTSAIYSNVSPGAAYFFDPEFYGYVYHRAGSYAPGGKALTGEQALNIDAGMKGDRIMTERFCQHLLSDDSLVFATLWLSEPDATGHGVPLNSEAHRYAIEQADYHVGLVWQCIDQLRANGEDIMLLVGSDHGMETIHAEVDIAAELVAAGLKQSATSQDIVVAPNGTAAVLGFEQDYPHTEALYRWLAAQEWVGDFVYGQQLQSWGMPDHAGSRVAISLAGNSQLNAEGLPGLAWYALDPLDRKNYVGYGQHGGRNPHEKSPFLIAQGSAFPQGSLSADAVSLLNYAPTVLQHFGRLDQTLYRAALQHMPSFVH